MHNKAKTLHQLSNVKYLIFIQSLLPSIKCTKLHIICVHTPLISEYIIITIYINNIF